MKFYADNVYVISRVNRLGNVWSSYHGRYMPHWVIRFLQSSNGVVGDPSDTELVLHRTGRGGKGEAAKKFQLTHFVDDSIDCLWSILRDPVANAMPWISGCPGGGGCILFCNDRARKEDQLRVHFESLVARHYYGQDEAALTQRARPAQSWKDVLDLLGLRIPPGAFRWFGPSFKSLFFFLLDNFSSIRETLRFIQV